jgi:hypothetical protein
MPEDIKRLAENKIDAGRTGVDLRRYRRAVTTGVAAGNVFNVGWSYVRL